MSGFRVSRDALGRFRDRYTRGSAVGALKMSNPIVKTVVKTTEVACTSFLFGFLHGRKGGMPETAKVPWDLGTAALMHTLGFLKVGAKHDAPWHMHNVGDGALSYYTGSMGAQLGQRMRKNAGQLTGAASPQGGMSFGSRTITQGNPQFYGGAYPGGMRQPAVHQWSPQQIAAMHRR